jgi:hypothetical protein
VVFSRKSQLLSAFTTKKVRQWPASGGVTVVSRGTVDADLVKQVLPFFEHWKWCGPAEVELKTDSRTGQSKVMEINPRFPGYVRLLIESGLDLPDSITSNVPRRQSAVIAFPPNWAGAEYREPVLALKTFLSEFRGGGQADGEFRAKLVDLLKATPTALRVLQDPLPLVGKAFRPIFGPDTPSVTIPAHTGDPVKVMGSRN